MIARGMLTEALEWVLWWAVFVMVAGVAAAYASARRRG